MGLMEWDGRHSFLLEYIDRCRAGEIVIGREMAQQLERVERQIHDPRYIFNLAEPMKRIRFIETMLRHTERPFAGKPFALELFQKAFIENVYGLQRFDEELGRWLRLTRRALLMVARKNGKTPLVAGIALSEFFCGAKGTRILVGSNDFDQAALMFDHINNMREESPRLEKVSRKNQKGIFMGGFRSKARHGKYTSENKAWIKKISAKTKSQDGRNLVVGIVDESHQQQEKMPEMIASMQQALSTQEEPLYIELTTEGTVIDGYLDNELLDARQILNEEVVDDTFAIWLFTQDNEDEIYQDESSWTKSNPGLGAIKKRGYLREQIEKARRSPASRPLILCKDFNIKQNQSAAWLNLEIIRNDERFELEDFRGGYYIFGVDMAETTDLNALRIGFMRPGDRKKYTFSHYWIPEAKADAGFAAVNPGTNQEKKDYRAWEAEGYVTVTPGNAVDTAVIADYQMELLEKYDMKPVRGGYDNRFAKPYIERFNSLFSFGENILEEVRQYPKVLSTPTREFEADLLDKLFLYNDHPIDRWCFLNAAIKTNSEGYIMLAKVLGKSENRIDGAAATVNYYAVLGWHKAEYMGMIV